MEISEIHNQSGCVYITCTWILISDDHKKRKFLYREREKKSLHLDLQNIPFVHIAIQLFKRNTFKAK